MFLQANQSNALNRLSAILIQVYPRMLGLLFLYAAVIKGMNRSNLHTVLTFDGIPQAIIPALSWCVITLEAVAGLILLILSPRRWLLTTAIGILIVYSGQLLYLVLAKDAPSCGCTELVTVVEQRQENRRENLTGLARNGFLMLAAGLTWLQVPDRKRSTS